MSILPNKLEKLLRLSMAAIAVATPLILGSCSRENNPIAPVEEPSIPLNLLPETHISSVEVSESSPYVVSAYGNGEDEEDIMRNLYIGLILRSPIQSMVLSFR